MATYLKGMAVNMRPRDLMSRTVEDSDTLKFGYAAFQGDNDRGCTADGDDFLGVVVHEENFNDGFEQYEQARIACRGVIAVEVSEDVSAGDEVGYDSDDGTFSPSGTIIKGARFEQSGSEGDIVPAFFDGNETESDDS